MDCSFLGLEHLTLGVFPPDTHGAVGRDFLMITLNDNIRIQARDGTNLFTQRLNAWWQTFDPTLIDVYDPRVLYDHEADRWIFTAAAQRLSAGACVLLAVSQTT